MLPILFLLGALAQAASARTVLAHFMVMYSYAYDVAQWEKDMRAAMQMNIDGFALNYKPADCDSNKSWFTKQVNYALTAADNVGFKIVNSFDMVKDDENCFWTAEAVNNILTDHEKHSSYLKWDGKPVMSTFGGEQVDGYGDSWFKDLKSKRSGNVVMAPALRKLTENAQGASDVTTAANNAISQYPSIDGFFNWQAWSTANAQSQTLDLDKALQSALKSNSRTGPYIMAISPSQFKFMNGTGWVAPSGNLFVDRLEQLIGTGFEPDIVELLTWNDWGESHYLRDLPLRDNKSAKDYCQIGPDFGSTYIWPKNHSPWRIIAKYYLGWWKTATPPGVSMDQVVFWHRTHPWSSCQTNVRDAKWQEDKVFAWTLVSSSATVTLSLGGDSNSTQADASGPRLLTVDFPAGLTSVTPSAKIERNGQVVHSGNSPLAITNSCSSPDYNYLVTLVGEGINTGVSGLTGGGY